MAPHHHRSALYVGLSVLLGSVSLFSPPIDAASDKCSTAEVDRRVKLNKLVLDPLNLASYRAETSALLLRNRTVPPRLVTFFVNATRPLGVQSPIRLADAAQVQPPPTYLFEGGYVDISAINRLPMGSRGTVRVGKVILVHNISTSLDKEATQWPAKFVVQINLAIQASRLTELMNKSSNYERCIDKSASSPLLTHAAELFTKGAADRVFRASALALASLLPHPAQSLFGTAHFEARKANSSCQPTALVMILDAVRKIPPDVLACFHNFANLGDVADLDRPTTHSSALQSPAKLIQPIRTGWSIPDRGRRQSNVSGSETIATGGNLTLKGPTGGPTVTAGSGVGGNSSGTGGAGGTAITGNTTGGTSISKGGSTGDGGSAGGGTGGGHGEGTGTGGSGGIGGKGGKGGKGGATQVVFQPGQQGQQPQQQPGGQQQYPVQASGRGSSVRLSGFLGLILTTLALLWHS